MVCVLYVCTECVVDVGVVMFTVLIAVEDFAGVPDRLFVLLQSASHPLSLLDVRNCFSHIRAVGIHIGSW